MLRDVPELDYATIATEFDTLMIAMGNKLDREWPPGRLAHDGLAPALRALMMVSANAYRTIAYVCADSPQAIERKLEYGLATTPLARTLLDALFTVIYLFEDPVGRPEQFYKGGWRELRAEHDRYEFAYSADPLWGPFIAEHNRFYKQITALCGITSAEEANPRGIPYWPTPSQMASRVTDPERKTFMDYLNAWFMRDLSQDSHLSWPGLVRRFKPLTIASGTERREVLTKWKSDAVATSLVLMQSMMSEIEIELSYGLAPRLKYVWGTLNPYLLISSEVYALRYEGRL